MDHFAYDPKITDDADAEESVMVFSPFMFAVDSVLMRFSRERNRQRIMNSKIKDLLKRNDSV